MNSKRTHKRFLIALENPLYHELSIRLNSRLQPLLEDLRAPEKKYQADLAAWKEKSKLLLSKYSSSDSSLDVKKAVAEHNDKMPKRAKYGPYKHKLHRDVIIDEMNALMTEIIKDYFSQNPLPKSSKPIKNKQTEVTATIGV